MLRCYKYLYTVYVTIYDVLKIAFILMQQIAASDGKLTRSFVLHLQNKWDVFDGCTIYFDHLPAGLMMMLCAACLWFTPRRPCFTYHQ